MNPRTEEFAQVPSEEGGKAMESSWLHGNMDSCLLPAGEVCGLIRDLPSAREVILRMVR